MQKFNSKFKHNFYSGSRNFHKYRIDNFPNHHQSTIHSNSRENYNEEEIQWDRIIDGDHIRKQIEKVKKGEL
ncbi:hypothetical protein V4D30_00880 [Thermodesulfovibrio sp. 3907-1M]|uniref:Uncharacterized protein n=1 Tax=Thermodesulfovibrio autotrophicus TaxID=3118333 RepID=A0AAU8GWJ4_9BACT